MVCYIFNQIHDAYIYICVCVCVCVRTSKEECMEAHKIDILPMLLYDYNSLDGKHIIDARSCLLIFLLITGYKCNFPFVIR